MKTCIFAFWMSLCFAAIAAEPSGAPLMEPGVKLFTDREYPLLEMPEAVRGLPFHRSSIQQLKVRVTKVGTLLALTSAQRPEPGPYSQEHALQKAGFTRVEAPLAQLFPGQVNRVCLYRKSVKQGEKFHFGKLTLLVLADGAAVRDEDGLTPSVITNPGAEFQDENRPGAMIIGMDRTPKGRIWGCWTGTGDKKDGYFLLATSEDDGESWSKPRLAVGARTEAGQQLSGALVGNLWTDPKGRLWLFFDQQLGDPEGRITNWFMRCDEPDAGEPVWSEPVQFSEGCTLNKPTVLQNGDWLLPVSDWHQKTARVFASTDEGASWKERGRLQFPDWEFDEHMMIELKDGRLWMLARTKGQPHESFSSDGGKTWSEPTQAATVQNVNARFFLRRLASGRILLVKNGPPTERLQIRVNMSAWLSEDEGQTWKGGLLLDERHAVSYPDGFENPDGLIHILYDWNRHTDAEILLAKFREEDVLAGKVVSKDAKLRMPVNKATGPKPEVLYNGIQLSLPWPPPHYDPGSAEPMPVPYLKRPPKVIPIDIGRQLFVDDFLIDKTNLTRTYHRAEKYEGNPVFKAETPHELNPVGIEGKEQAVTYLGHGGVFYHPEKERFEMFYTAGWRGGLALATSKDLIHWERPQLGLAGDNLIWPPGWDFAGGDNAVWLDPESEDPAQRYKMIVDRGRQGFHTLHTSADGRIWSHGANAGKAGDYCSFFYNPFREVWVQSIKRESPRGRSRHYSESKDFLAGADRSQSVYWANADRLDEPDPEIGNATQLYSLNAVAYESLLLGEFYIHQGPVNKVCAEGQFPKITELKLGFSRDGFHWHRPDRRAFIEASRKKDDNDRAYLHGTNGVMLVKDDKLWFPYCAYSGVAPNGHRGMYTGATINMATLRRDGFASMDADAKGGTLTTRPVVFDGKHLFVNVANPKGELRVEVLDASNRVIEPYSKENSTVVKTDSTLHRVTWKGKNGTSLEAVKGRNVKFRFHLSNGSLYAFWVSKHLSGASLGYLGAGGPGFDTVIDTQGDQHRVDESVERKDALLPADVHTAPVAAKYQDENRMFLCGPGITVSPSGRLWVTFKTGDIWEDEDNCTVVVTSGDKGETWSKPVVVVDIDGPVRTNDPGIWTDPNGKVTLMWGQVYGFWDGRGGFWTMTAENGDDENTKWSQPVRLSDGYTKNKPFITRDGKWLYLIEHMGPQGRRGRFANGALMERKYHHPLPELNHANVFVSEDQGKTLRYLSQAKIPEQDKTFQEHMLVEKKDGTLWMLGRAKYGVGESFSKDGGQTWTEMAPAKGIQGPSSRTFFQRLQSGNILLIKNGAEIDQPSKRTHMTAYLSEDDGETWPHKLLLDERATSYPDAAQDGEGVIHIVHDFGRTDEKEVCFHRITEADIKAGKLVTAGSALGKLANKATHATVKAGEYEKWKNQFQ